MSKITRLKRKPGRKPIGDNINVRFSPEDERTIRQLAHDRREQVSPMLRAVIQRWLAAGAP